MKWMLEQVLIYQDNNIIVGPTFVIFLSHLEKVSPHLDMSSLYIKPSQRNLKYYIVKYQGHIVSE